VVVPFPKNFISPPSHINQRHLDTKFHEFMKGSVVDPEADPDPKLIARFGTGSGISILDPRIWIQIRIRNIFEGDKCAVTQNYLAFYYKCYLIFSIGK